MLSNDLIKGAAAAAKYLGPAFNRNAVYHMTATGHLPVIRKGKLLFYRRSDLDRAFASQTENQAA